MREVGEEDLGLGALAGQADRVLDLLARDGPLERGQVERHGRALRADLDVLDPDVERQRRGVEQRAADGLGDAAPVGVAAVLAQAVAGPEVEYTVALPGEGAEAEVFFSDLSCDYVKINSEYTT